MRSNHSNVLMYLHGNSTGMDNDDDDGQWTTPRNFNLYLEEVCASFILVLMLQIVHTEKPRVTSKQNEAQIT